jgi:transcriptional regulator with XRE-family HTH domain
MLTDKELLHLAGGAQGALELASDLFQRLSERLESQSRPLLVVLPQASRSAAGSCRRGPCCEVSTTKRRVACGYLLAEVPPRGSSPGASAGGPGNDRGFVDVGDDARTIGARLRHIRNSRKKSLVVIAGLAGISKSHLSRIERGERALDSRSETVALANALQIAPSKLTSLPVPAPGDGSTDAAVNAVLLALIAASRDRLHDQVVPLDVLQRRVRQIRETRRQCGFGAVGERLPGLIGDIHSSIGAGREVKTLVELAVIVHVRRVRLTWPKPSWVL